MARILVADDKDEFRTDAKTMLGENGEFQVVLASTPEEATYCLDASGIDVAVIDLRLRGGGEDDKSGLDVARRSNQFIPIIMVTSYNDLHATMEAVNTRADGYPLLVRYLSKQAISDQPDRLLSAVRSALKARELWSKSEREKIKPELVQHYRSDRNWANIYQGLHYLTSMAFVSLMIYEALNVKAEPVHLIFAMIAILAGEITNIIVSQREGSIARRADKNHDEVLQAARFSQLFDACSSLADPEAGDRAKSELLRIAAQNWFVPDMRSVNNSSMRLINESDDSNDHDN